MYNQINRDIMKNSTATRSRSLSLNTNFMDSEPVRCLVENGNASALVTFLALQTLIRAAGYCVTVDDTLIGRLAAMTGRDAPGLRADIAVLVESGFFDAGIYSAHNVLTTRRLQSAYRRRKDAQPIPEHLQLKARRSSTRRRAAKAAVEPVTTAEPAAAGTAAAADGRAVVETVGEEVAGADSGERRMSRSARRRARRRAARLARQAAERRCNNSSMSISAQLCPAGIPR